ncbi:major facilitator superfamily domain-containing protein [Paraphoma chrysanthemicola]|uniref:Major facilitator superfamily domain-containing protein n=1 Tax=Paraphoma chrysanthemicola TaxID=798071 RepID=A0A8K0W4G9_9PLEO|nr:major facilitator superfamily domain-containing protein [Paraphoma chrysanthemicola]
MDASRPISEAISPAPSTPDGSMDCSNVKAGHSLKTNNMASKPKKSIQFQVSFLVLNIMVLMVSLDATALAVATPVITEELHGTTIEAFWASLSFLLVVAVAQPIYTSISEVFGRKSPLYSSFAWFILGSIVFAIAKSMPVLIVGRIFQGIGAGGLDVLGEIILVDMTTLKERPLYLGLFAIPMAGGVILGPIIGALCTEYAGWRWLGWINLPISTFNLVLIAIFMRLKPIEGTLQTKFRRVDWLGMTLFAIGCTAFACPLSWAGAIYPWKSWQTILPLILGFAILAIFALYENGHLVNAPTEPLFPARLFKSVTASAALACSFFHGAIMYSGIFYMPLIFQAVFLETPLQSAISILPLCCTSVAFGAIAGILVECIRKYRYPIIVSWMLTTIGCALVVTWSRESNTALQSGTQVLLGVGIGPFFSLLILPIQASVRNIDDSGIAAGIFVCFRLFGGLVGLAMCSTVFSNVFALRVARLAPLPDPVALLSDASRAIAFIPQLRLVDLPDHDMDEIADAYRVAMMAVFLMLAGLAAAGLLVSFVIFEHPIESSELGRQRLVDGEGGAQSTLTEGTEGRQDLESPDLRSHEKGVTVQETLLEDPGKCQTRV